MIAVERTMGDRVNITMTDLTVDQAMVLYCLVNIPDLPSDRHDLIAMGFEPGETDEEVEEFLATFDLPIHSLASLLERALEGPMTGILDVEMDTE